MGANLCGVDPYLTKNSRNEEIRQLKEKLSQKESELRSLRAAKGGYNNNPGVVNKFEPGKSYVKMTADQKKAVTCADWNGAGCAQVETAGHCGTGRNKKNTDVPRFLVQNAFAGQ